MIEDGPSSVTRSVTRLVRLFGTIAFVVSLTIALIVRVGINDGGWPLFVPPIAAAAVIVWPIRSVVVMAILVHAAIITLGILSVCIFYGVPLAALIFALFVLRSGAAQA
jgi:hypothetical protein